MGIERNIGRSALVVALLIGAASATAAPPEPLIVTQLPDPDPNYAAPPGSRRDRTRASGDMDQSPTLDEAIQDFGRAIGQAVRLEQQAIEQKCRSVAAARARSADVLAWQASCRYARR
jgi:hypothetical protein